MDIEAELLARIEKLEKEIESYKLQEQIHLNRLKIAENKGGNRDAR